MSDALAQLRGVAACRGETWAMRVVGRTHARPPWPTFDDPKCRAIARRKVADLAVDERLRDELALIANVWAALRWSRL
jgi:hypothetical protein